MWHKFAICLCIKLSILLGAWPVKMVTFLKSNKWNSVLVCACASACASVCERARLCLSNGWCLKGRCWVGTRGGGWWFCGWTWQRGNRSLPRGDPLIWMFTRSFISQRQCSPFVLGFISCVHVSALDALLRVWGWICAHECNWGFISVYECTSECVDSI